MEAVKLEVDVVAMIGVQRHCWQMNGNRPSWCAPRINCQSALSAIARADQHNAGVMFIIAGSMMMDNNVETAVIVTDNAKSALNILHHL